MLTVTARPTLVQSAAIGPASGPWSIAASAFDTTKPAKKASVSERSIWTLRDRMRWISANARTRSCGAKCISSAGASLVIRYPATGPKASFHGVLSCEHRWTCPVCAARISAERRAQVTAAVFASPKGKQWQMVTLTIRHQKGTPLADLLAGLKKCWRKTRSQTSVNRIWKRRVYASIRAFEITWSQANGWHPHIHILMLGGGLEADELVMLAETWERMAARWIGERNRPSRAVGVKMSAPVRDASDARYLAKLGLELTWTRKKPRSNESRGPWDIARDAVDGDTQSIALWREYESATRGTRAIELDERAARLARIGADMAEAAIEEPDGEFKEAPEESIYLDPHALYALRRTTYRRAGFLWEVLRAVERVPRTQAESVLDSIIQWALANATGPPPHVLA